MGVRRRVAVVGMLAACLLLATGTGGFSSVEAERGVSVDVVGDEDAYLGLVTETKESSVTTNQSTEYLTVTNQFTKEVDVTVEDVTNVTSTNLTVSDIDTSANSLGSGEEASLYVDFECVGTGKQSATISYHVTASSDDDSVSVETTAKRQTRFDSVSC